MQTHFSFDQSSHTEDVNFCDYYWFKNAFSKEELAKIEEMTSDLPQQLGVTQSGDTELHRKSKIKWCPQTEEWKWVYGRLHDLIVQANNAMWKFDLTDMPEMIQYTEYYEDGGQYDWHMDCGIEMQNRRKVSVTVQLSSPEDYEGGDLEFNLGNILNGPREQGAAVIFPSFYLHRVTPITKGVRKSFVLWVGGEPYK